MCLWLVFLIYSGKFSLTWSARFLEVTGKHRLDVSFKILTIYLSLKVALNAVSLAQFIWKNNSGYARFIWTVWSRDVSKEFPMAIYYRKYEKKEALFIGVTIHWDCLPETFCRSFIHHDLRHLNLSSFRFITSLMLLASEFCKHWPFKTTLIYLIFFFNNPVRSRIYIMSVQLEIRIFCKFCEINNPKKLKGTLMQI